MLTMPQPTKTANVRRSLERQDAVINPTTTATANRTSTAQIRNRARAGKPQSIHRRELALNLWIVVATPKERCGDLLDRNTV